MLTRYLINIKIILCIIFFVNIHLINTIFPQEFVSDDDVSILDYSVPVSQALDLKVNFSWLWTNTSGEEDTINNQISGSFDFLYFYTSPRFSIELTADSDISYSTNAQESTSVSKYHHDYPLQWTISAFDGNPLKYYPVPEMDFFILTEIPGVNYTYYDPHVESNISVGFGYGRFIDATAMVKARRLNEFLIEEDIVNGYFPGSVLIELAKLLDDTKENEYEAEYGDLYKTYWYTDIAEVIEASDAFIHEESIGAIGILRIDQIIENSFGNIWVNRFKGWDVSMLFGYTISEARIKPDNNLYLKISQRFSIPIGWLFHIGQKFSVLSYLNHEDYTFLKHAKINAEIILSLEFSHIATLQLSYEFVYDDYAIQGSYSREHNSNLSLLFNLENKIRLSISGSLIHTKFDIESGEFELDQRLDISFLYDIL